MTKPNSAELWRGPSLIDGAPIVVIVSGLNASANSKTGNMLQTYILRADVAPTDAIRSGADASICGDCPARGDGTGKGRTCYVNVGQGPLAVWRAWQRGTVPHAVRVDGLFYVGGAANPTCIGAGRMVRLGTYGDPAAVPADVWHSLTTRAIGHTGYTHQWRKAFAAPLRTLCMASADSEQDAADARAAGWRFFRVAFPGDAPRRLDLGESVCPASAEAGYKLTCESCRACSGANGRRGSIVIQAHGGFAVMANVRRKGA
jgi:hypothetical protein